jgi:SAM-dependent methyltransferase
MSLGYVVSGWNRRRKWKLFLHEMSPTHGTTVLDVGFSEVEHSITDNFLEKHYPFPNRITALSTDVPVEFLKRYPQVRAVHYKGDVFPFPDHSFDLCWCNAVLEHVGGWKKQARFTQEIKRVAKKAFITTPNRYFPIEVHTRTPLLHWLPKPIFESYLRLIGKEWASGEYMHLLSEYELKTLLAEAGIGGYKIIRNRLLGWTLDFVVIM